MIHVDGLIEIFQGGIRLYAESQLDAIKEGLVNFQQKSDTKASVMVPLDYTSGQVCKRPTKEKLLLVQTDH